MEKPYLSKNERDRIKQIVFTARLYLHDRRAYAVSITFYIDNDDWYRTFVYTRRPGTKPFTAMIETAISTFYNGGTPGEFVNKLRQLDTDRHFIRIAID